MSRIAARSVLQACFFAHIVTVVASEVVFSEQFSDGWESRWVRSEEKVASGRRGEWIKSAGSRWVRNIEEDSGLMTSGDLARYGISASFSPFSNADRPLIVQFQVKHDKDPVCGGAYLKVGPSLKDPMHFGDPTPFFIQFGPDTCGPSSRRTHLIFAHEGRAELKKEDLPYKQDHGLSHLYRMTLLPNNTVAVDIDEESIYKGILHEDWEFPDTSDLYLFEDIGFVGFELWQMHGGSIFDNIILTDDEVEANAFSQKWRSLHSFEVEAMNMERAAKKAIEQEGEM